ncbi:PRC-barrel domain-containing protein [Thioalkalivibrio sp. AKL19]|uniref:PRC-barrel domain-containing protein n=1 Tax=Thioalkalivibrio sp. AKL19 TaxID=1266914 RepID=UPI000462E2F4|nr:PRC-barrel domain-containing protein [Thioalkalivibrio sp. AKL19]
MIKLASTKLVAASVPLFVFGLAGVMNGTIAGEYERGANGHEVMEERRADARDEAPHLQRMPDQGLHVSDLMDQKIHDRASHDEIGEIHDLVIDRDGRIVAVVISTGSGVLGLGGKDVAIAWDRIERTTEDGEVKLYINMNEDTLQETPEYVRD